MRYAYAATAALLLSGSAYALTTGDASPVATGLPVSATLAQAGLAPGGAPPTFADLAAKLQPAVVNIATKQKVQVATSFNPFTGERRPITQDQASGGSGFLIASDGYIVTNNHVISGGPQGAAADTITVTLFDGTEYKATLVGRDASSDIALLKISATGLPFVAMGDSKQSRVGDWVVAIGNPLGLGNTVTAGIVSALQRNIGAGGAYDRFIQTDTAINPGNSGGPLFNLKGEVIGINNRLISPIGANIGVGFAIPAEEAAPVVDALRKGQRPERGFIGVGMRGGVDPETAEALGIAKNRGEVVGSLVADQPAAKAGLKEDDIVLKVNGRDVTPEQTLSYLVANVKPGTRIPIEILREGKLMTVQVTVGSRPSDEELVQTNFNPEEPKTFGSEEVSGDQKVVRDALGVSVLVLNPALAAQLRVGSDVSGLVVDIVGDGNASQKGVQRGDILVTANYQKITSVEALAKVIRDAKAAGRTFVRFGVKRGPAPVAPVTISIE